MNWAALFFRFSRTMGTSQSRFGMPGMLRIARPRRFEKLQNRGGKGESERIRRIDHFGRMNFLSWRLRVKANVVSLVALVDRQVKLCLANRGHSWRWVTLSSVSHPLKKRLGMDTQVKFNRL